MNGPGTSQSTEVSTEKLKGFIIKAVKHAYFGSRLNIRLETKGPKDFQEATLTVSAN